MQAGDDRLHMARFEVRGETARPLLGAPRALAKLEARVGPGIFHRVPEIEDLAAGGKERRALPDPFGAIADDHDHRLGTEPPALAQRRTHLAKQAVGVREAGHHNAPDERGAVRQGHPVGRLQQHRGLHFAEGPVGHGR